VQTGQILVLKKVRMKDLNMKYIGTIVLISAATYLAMHYLVLPALPEKELS